MPSADVRWPLPLNRLNPWYPGQMGVPGGWSETGLRQHCTGAIFYVDPNYPGVSDQRDGTEPTDPLETVAAALTKCQAYRGDTIAVMANNDWYYGKAADGYATGIVEEVTVNVPGVRIVGVSPSGSLGPVWTPASNGGTCVTVSALDVLIEGFVFTEGDYTGCDAIYCEWDGATLFGENLTVRHCYFDDTVYKAIQLEYSWYCRLLNNTFMQCDEHGVYVDPAGSGIAYVDIINNHFHDCAVAMALRNADNCSIHANRIYNGNAEAGAVATDEGIDTTGGRQNMITENWFSCLLPVPANGDWDDLNTASATDAWIGNHCLNGLAITSPT